MLSPAPNTPEGVQAVKDLRVALDGQDQTYITGADAEAIDADAATGSHYMSSEFRMALEERRLYLKVFGVSLPSAGAVQLLE